MHWICSFYVFWATGSFFSGIIDFRDCFLLYFYFFNFAFLCFIYFLKWYAIIICEQMRYLSRISSKNDTIWSILLSWCSIRYFRETGYPRKYFWIRAAAFSLLWFCKTAYLFFCIFVLQNDWSFTTWKIKASWILFLRRCSYICRNHLWILMAFWIFLRSMYFDLTAYLKVSSSNGRDFIYILSRFCLYFFIFMPYLYSAQFWSSAFRRYSFCFCFRWHKCFCIGACLSFWGFSNPIELFS